MHILTMWLGIGTPLLIILSLSLHFEEVEGWVFGWCKPKCKLDPWGGWSSCSRTCGGGSRSRSRSICCGPGQSVGYCLSDCNLVSGDLWDNGYCSRTCVRGYFSWSQRSCQCPDEYYGTCCSDSCKYIPNCKAIRCTTGTNQVCKECKDTFVGYNAYYLSSDKRSCTKLCSWKSDSTFCYPGTCPYNSNTCTCAAQFSGTNCLTIKNGPTISKCDVKGFRNGRLQLDGISCEIHRQKTFSGSQLDVIETDTMAIFKPLVPRRPNYIKESKIGVIQASIKFELLRGNKKIESKLVDCGLPASVTSPIAEYDCSISFEIPWNQEHADVLLATPQAKNGGFVDVHNPPTHSNYRHYYRSKTTSRTAQLVFDFEPPVHCSLGNGTCNMNYLDIGESFTKDGAITLKWSGWVDLVSGIDVYHIDIFKLMASGELLKPYHTPDASYELVSADTSKNITLNETGVFAIELRPIDKAKNHIIARRFVIFDNINHITIHNNNKSRALWVPSAARNTAYEWLTDLQNNLNRGPPVLVKWVHHFTNEVHDKNKWLNAIAEHTNQQNVMYEDAVGQPPVTRSREAIPNIHGITRYEIAYTKSLLFAPTVWSSVSAFKTEEAVLDIPRVDGDLVIIYVRAFDVTGHKTPDGVLIHVDSSPPIITDILLTQNGASLQVVTFDLHSGINQLSLELRTTISGHKYGSATYPVSKEPRYPCSPVCVDCYLTSYGDCYRKNITIRLDKAKISIPDSDKDKDFFFELTSTNNAMLQQIHSVSVNVSALGIFEII